MTDLFEDTKEPNNDGTASVASLLADLVGPDKKFKTHEDLAKGKVESDRFIDTLKEEAAGMRSQLEQLQKQADTASSLQAMLDKIAASKDTGEGTAPRTPGTPEDISKIVREEVSAMNQERTRKLNKDKANAALLAKYGNAEAAKAHLKAEAERLDMDVKALGVMSETSPAAFAKLIGLDVRTDPMKGAPLTSRNDIDQTSSLTGERNAEYYSKLRRELGPKYWHVDIQQQRMKDAMRLGADYHKK